MIEQLPADGGDEQASTHLDHVNGEPEESRIWDPTNIDTTRITKTFTAICRARACRSAVEHPAVIARKMGTLPGGLMMDTRPLKTRITSLMASTKRAVI